MKAYRFAETKNNWNSAPNEENGDEDRLPVALTFTEGHTDAGTVTVGPWERSSTKHKLGSVSGWVSADCGFCGGPCWRLYTRTANHLTESRAPLLNPRSNTVLRLNTSMCVHPYYSHTAKENDHFLFRRQ